MPLISDDNRWNNYARSVGIGAGLCGALIGLIALIGWAANIPRLTDWTNNGISMFPNTALCALLSGAGLILYARAHGLLAALAGGLVTLVALATLFQHISGIALGIDTLLWQRDFGARAAAAPLRMGVPASICFVLIGGSLVASGTRRVVGRATRARSNHALRGVRASRRPLHARTHSSGEIDHEPETDRVGPD